MIHKAANFGLGTYYCAEPSLPFEITSAARQARDSGVSGEFDTEADGHRTRAYLQFLAPPPHLLVCGAGPDAEPVVAAARALGWQVTVVDHRGAYIDNRRFPSARALVCDADALRTGVDLGHCHAAVVLSHLLSSDAAYLRELAAAGTPGYGGLLGPLARRQRLMQDLGPAATSLDGRLHGPVGLNLGGVTTE